MCTATTPDAMPPPAPSSDHEDPWAGDSDGGDGDGPAHAQELDREWRAREQQYFNTGYRDGLDDGKARTTQHGFDAGFRAGAAAGFEAGAVRGALDVLRGLLPPPPPPPAAPAPSSSSSSLESLAALFASLPKAAVAADLCSRLAAAPLREGDVLGAGRRAASDAAARAAARAAAGRQQDGGAGEADDDGEVEDRVAVSEEELRAALARLDQVAAAVAAERGRPPGEAGAGGGGAGDGAVASAPEALRLPEPSTTSADTRAMMDELRAALRERLGGLDVAAAPPPPP